MRFFVCLGLVAILALQYRYWFSDAGRPAVVDLTERIEAEARRNDRLERRNRLLAAEIAALKGGLDAVEGRARTSLGMIAEGETFFLVVDDDAQTEPESEGGLEREDRTEGEGETPVP